MRRLFYLTGLSFLMRKAKCSFFPKTLQLGDCDGVSLVRPEKHAIPLYLGTATGLARQRWGERCDTELLRSHKALCETITFDNGKEFAEHEVDDAVSNPTTGLASALTTTSLTRC